MPRDEHMKLYDIVVTPATRIEIHNGVVYVDGSGSIMLHNIRLGLYALAHIVFYGKRHDGYDKFGKMICLQSE